MHEKTASTHNAFCSITGKVGSFCICAAENFRTVENFSYTESRKMACSWSGKSDGGADLYYSKQATGDY